MSECHAAFGPDDSTDADPGCRTALSIRASAFSIDAIMASRIQPERSGHSTASKDPLSGCQEDTDDCVADAPMRISSESRENSDTQPVSMETGMLSNSIISDPIQRSA